MNRTYTNTDGSPLPPRAADPRPRSRRPWIALGAVLCAALSGCAEQSDAVPATRPTAGAEAPIHLAEQALGFEAGDAPTERLIADAQEAVRNDPSSIDAHAALAVTFIRRARETSNSIYMLYAEDAIRAGRSRVENDPQLLALHAMVLQDRHRFRAARSVARKVIAARPSDPTGYILLGDAELELGAYDGAVEAYQQALDMRPDLRSYNRGAHLRWLTGDFEGAVELIELAIDAGSARDPESIAWCFVDLGTMYRQRGATAEALKAAERALGLVDGYAPALALKGRTLADVGRRAEGIHALEQVVARKPSVEDLLVVVELLEADGQNERAQTRMREAERLGSGEPRALAHYYARRNHKPAEAVALAERELHSRANIAAHDTHALALLRAGRTEAAGQAMDRALALGTPDAALHLHRAMIARARGDIGSARAGLALALELNPHVDPMLVEELRGTLGDRRL